MLSNFLKLKKYLARAGINFDVTKSKTNLQKIRENLFDYGRILAPALPQMIICSLSDKSNHLKIFAQV